MKPKGNQRKLVQELKKPRKTKDNQRKTKDNQRITKEKPRITKG
jgi:hypothetical protein